MVKNKRKTLLALLIVLIIANAALIVATSLNRMDPYLYPQFRFGHPLMYVISLIPLLITDGLIIAFFFKAKGIGVRIFVAILICLSSVFSWMFCDLSFFNSWTSETDDTENFLIVEERSESMLEVYVGHDLLNFDKTEVSSYKYRYSMSNEINLDFTAKLTAERYAMFKAMLADRENATVIDQNSIIEFYIDQWSFDPKLGEGVKFEVEFSDEDLELHYKFWFKHLDV